MINFENIFTGLMRRLYITGVLLIMLTRAFTQVGSFVPGLRLWLKADYGTSCTTDGCPVANWTDIAGYNDATQATATCKPKYENSTADLINYNPSLKFDGADDYMTVIGFSSAFSNEGQLYIVSHNPSGLTEREIFDQQWGEGSNFPWIDLNYYNDFVLVTGSPPPVGFTATNPFIFAKNINAATSTTTHYFNGASAATIIDNPLYDPKMDMIFGDGDFDGSLPYDGKIAEIIASNSALTSTSHQVVESYLAVKYGITMPHNYYTSSSSEIYNTSTYNKNIIGIGRDDDEELLQKQSHSLDDTTRIYMSTLAATNPANATTATDYGADRAYVITGNNNGQMCATIASALEMPPSVYSRLEREWKVTKTNFAGAFNMDFKLAACALLFMITPADLILMVDNDGGFNDATVYSSADGLTFTYSGGVITVSGITSSHIANNSTKYITIGSISETTPLPIVLVEFSATPVNDQVKLEWMTSSELNNDFFTVQRSVNGNDWKDIAIADGAGNSYTSLNYTVWDDDPLTGKSFYRLRQTDFNGTPTYSNIIFVEITGDESIHIYPNPSAGNLFAELPALVKDQLTVYAINDLGQKINLKFSVESNLLILDISTLKTGVYALYVSSDIMQLQSVFVKR